MKPTNRTTLTQNKEKKTKLNSLKFKRKAKSSRYSRGNKLPKNDENHKPSRSSQNREGESSYRTVMESVLISLVSVIVTKTGLSIK